MPSSYNLYHDYIVQIKKNLLFCYQTSPNLNNRLLLKRCKITIQVIIQLMLLLNYIVIFVSH